MMDEAANWANEGIRHLKVKLSGDVERDVGILSGLRARVGMDMGLQVDANGAYADIDSAKPVIGALNDAGVNVIEDLFHIGDIESLQSSRLMLDGQLMLDKDAHWPHVTEILKRGVMDIVNQHPHNQGGMGNAMAIANAAAEYGIFNAIGSSGLLGIQNTAFLHLASVTGLQRPCEDIGIHTYYDVPFTTGLAFDRRPTVLSDPVMMTDGHMTLPAGPGLGIIVDRELLGERSCERIAFGEKCEKRNT